MAARLRPRHQQEIRDKIQASNILHRIQRFVLEEDYEMNPSKVMAGLKLLNKCLPDAIPDVVQAHHEAQTLLAAHQLKAMALEYLNDTGVTIDHDSSIDTDKDSIESIPLEIPASSDDPGYHLVQTVEVSTHSLRESDREQTDD